MSEIESEQDRLWWATRFSPEYEGYLRTLKEQTDQGYQAWEAAEIRKGEADRRLHEAQLEYSQWLKAASSSHDIWVKAASNWCDAMTPPSRRAPA